jgi:hypothetical protein
MSMNREGLARYPSLFEINTRVWLCRLSQEAGKPVTLANVDDATLDDVARRGFDWIWLLSVWQTGAAGGAVSRGNPAWQAEFQAALPDLTEDICGSGFAITAYRSMRRWAGGPHWPRCAPGSPRAVCGSCSISFPITPRSIIHGSRRIPISMSRAASRLSPLRRRTIAGSTPIRGRASWPMVAIPISPAGRTRCN